MKFEIIDPIYGYKLFQSNDSDSLIRIGNIDLCKPNEYFNCCQQYEDEFNYKGYNKALCGKTGKMIQGFDGCDFTPKRICVIQMN